MSTSRGTIPELPEPDGYAAISGVGTIIVPPRDFAKHNGYAIFTAEQMHAYAKEYAAALSQPAAADEVLAALKAIVHSAELNQAAISTFLLIDARAAIAKATP